MLHERVCGNAFLTLVGCVVSCLPRNERAEASVRVLQSHARRRAAVRWRAALRMQRKWHELLARRDALDELIERRRLHALLCFFARAEHNAVVRIQHRFLQVRLRP